ncbi:hypothetical protein BDAP_000706 [Binucleata daphniae]
MKLYYEKSLLLGMLTYLVLRTNNLQVAASDQQNKDSTTNQSTNSDDASANADGNKTEGDKNTSGKTATDSKEKYTFKQNIKDNKQYVITLGGTFISAVALGSYATYIKMRQ